MLISLSSRDSWIVGLFERGGVLLILLPSGVSWIGGSFERGGVLLVSAKLLYSGCVLSKEFDKWRDSWIVGLFKSGGVLMISSPYGVSWIVGLF
jgi:hypothetical protein